MKKLLFLLIIPTISYSQITFEDIMSINSEKTFKRVMIENGLEYDDNDFNEDLIFYGLDIVRDSLEESKSKLWCSYYKRNGEFKFQIVIRNKSGKDFFGREIGGEIENNPYDILVEKIKKNCKYYDVLNENGVDYVCYSCPQSTYKGKIGFTKVEGNGMIKHIIPKQPITFNDVMSINSTKTFHTILNGKGYHFNDEDEDWIDYGINVVNDSIMGSISSEWGIYNKKTNEFYFKYGWNDDYDYDFYDVLIDDIKKNCTFYDTLKNNGPNKRDYISYSCPQSTYKGKIGYTITDSISLIKHIIPTEEEIK